MRRVPPVDRGGTPCHLLWISHFEYQLVRFVAFFCFLAPKGGAVCWITRKPSVHKWRIHHTGELKEVIDWRTTVSVGKINEFPRHNERVWPRDGGKYRYCQNTRESDENPCPGRVDMREQLHTFNIGEAVPSDKNTHSETLKRQLLKNAL